jgi:RNA polymerase sigma-70 factor (ECF subfamily)
VQPVDREVDFADDLDARIDAERQARELVGRLERLPGRHRDVVGLCVLAELTYEEAALALGIPVGTVRSRLSRARRRLALATEVPDRQPAERLATTNGAQ